VGPVVVTGGCGFIGSHIVEGLLKADPSCQIHVIDLDSKHNRIHGATYHDCDIAALSDVEAIFLEKRVYTLTKVEAEAEVFATNRQDGNSSMLTVSIRPVTAFGERDNTCMGKTVATCRAGRTNMQIGPGKNYYDVVYVTNLADAHILAAQALIRAYSKPPPPLEARVDGQSFIITNDERILFWDFQRAISASVGPPVKQDDIKIIPRWVAMLAAAFNEWSTWILSWGTKQSPNTREAVHLSTITCTLKCNKAKRELGYKPRVSIHEGFEKAGKWFVGEAKRTEETKKTI
ncbi:NAD(P)-binding protein, partial [Cryphonectria parasitica EP155]